MPGRDVSFSISLLEIDLHIRRSDFPTAFALLEKLATKTSEGEADVFHHIKIMILKARIYDKAGITQKGFSVAVRAAVLAHEARVLPALWEAIGAVSRVLISLKEFDAAVRLLESVMPRVLEGEDCNLAARTYSSLADAHMGMAGMCEAEAQQRKEQVLGALEYIDRSFDEFSRIEDITGQCEMMAKKATIMHLNGEPVLANDCAAKYLDMKKSAKKYDGVGLRQDQGGSTGRAGEALGSTTIFSPIAPWLRRGSTAKDFTKIPFSIG